MTATAPITLALSEGTPAERSVWQEVVDGASGLFALLWGTEHDLPGALAAATSPWVLWADPRLVPQAGWADGWAACLARGRAVAAFVGRVQIQPPVEPLWLRSEAGPMLHWLGEVDFGPAPRRLAMTDLYRPLPEGQLLVRRSRLLRLLDKRRGANAAGAHEPDAEDRDDTWSALAHLARAGGQVRYVVAPRAHRPVPREHLVPRWFVDRAFAEGRVIGQRVFNARRGGRGRGLVGATAVAGSPSSLARSASEDLARVLQSLVASRLPFSRLSLGMRIEVARRMGIARQAQLPVATLTHTLEDASLVELLDGDCPEAFVSWAVQLRRSAAAAPSIGVA